MHSRITELLLDIAVGEELQNAIEQHGGSFQDEQEYMSVLKNELYELAEEIQALDYTIAAGKLNEGEALDKILKRLIIEGVQCRCVIKKFYREDV